MKILTIIEVKPEFIEDDLVSHEIARVTMIHV